MVLRRLYVPEQRMTFGGHLDELRRRILTSILAVVVAAVFCLFFQDFLVGVILGPHTRASAERAKAVAYRILDRGNGALAEVAERLPELAPASCAALLPELDREARLREALIEPAFAFLEGAGEGIDREGRRARAAAFAHALSRSILQSAREDLSSVQTGKGLSVRIATVRERFARLMEEQGGRLKGYILKSSAEVTAGILPEVAGAFETAEKRAQGAPPAVQVKETGIDRDRERGLRLAEELNRALGQVEKAIDTLESGKGAKIFAITYTEQFFTYLKVVLIAAIFLAHPAILWQMWRFIGAGLYQHEQRVALTFVPFSLLLFIMGVAFGYAVLIPWGFSYLSSYGDPELVDTVMSLSAYLSLFLSLTVLLGLVFQVPLVMFFLARSGLIEPATFSRVRRHAILIGVVLAAVLTPPDPFTQLMLAVPLVILYEIGILVSKVGHSRAEESERRAEQRRREGS